MTIITEHIQPLLETKRIPAALVAAFLLQTAGYVPVERKANAGYI
jgi:hypothetical protein